jgi:hypothetical protein
MLNKFSVLFLFIFITSAFYSQLIVGGGFNSIGAVNIKQPYLGINLLGEYRNDDMAYFAKFYTTLPQNDSQILIPMESLKTDELLNLQLSGFSKYNYNVLEFGKKNFYGEDLDFGPGGYLSSHFSLIMNTLNFDPDNFDVSRYRFPDGYVDKARIYSLAAGVNLGGQYAFFHGTYYIDFGINYTLIASSSNSFNQMQQFSSFNSYRQLIFVFNIGFKKTIFSTY